MKEVHILKSLKHPNIPIIYDIEEDENYSYIIEEYFQGESLKTYRMRLSCLNERSIIDLTSQICDLMQYLHRLDKAVLYLDLKPENILIFEGKLKLLDFGAAQYAEKEKKISCQMATAAYMAPERLNNRVDQRSDIYSIGCLLYFLITGTSYQPSKVLKRWSWILIRNRRFYKLMERCLKSTPSKRFRSVEELAKNLDKVSKKGESNKESAVMSYCIAIAGTENRVGVTHIALAFTSYLSMVHKGSIYIECNASCFLREFVTVYPEVKERDGYWYVHHIWMQDRENWQEHNRDKKFLFQVKDYGALCEANLQQFLNEEHKLLVVGTKPWEWRRSLCWLNKLCDCEDILYLLNMESGRTVSNAVDGFSCIHIPFLEKLFYDGMIAHHKTIFDSVINYVVQSRKEGD